MGRRLDLTGADARLNDCWNRIGVRGDGSCPELRKYVHCRNCPVCSAAAALLLDADAPLEYLTERTAHFAEPLAADHGETRSVVIFRIGSEWLALPTLVVVEIANPLPVHSLPHRKNGIVLGLVSIRGELLVCVSLRELVGAQDEAAGPSSHPRKDTSYRRLLVLRRESSRIVAPVDEVQGICRFRPSELEDVPTTIAKATGTYSTSVLPWQGHSVGTLDDQLLFYTVKRSLG